MRLLRGSLSLLTALLLAVALTACGGDDSDDSDGASGDDGPSTSESEPGGSESPEEAEESPDGVEGTCPFLTVAAVAEALGTDVELTTAGEQTCFFTALGDATELQVVVNEVPISVDAATYAEGARDVCDGEITEVDVPDAVDAFACVAFTTQGFLYVEGDSIVLDVNGVPDDETGLAAAAALLPEVTIP